jgi:heme/copper-type cytochrome/quinol oxidase subunit 2
MEENTTTPAPAPKSGMNMVLVVVALAIVLIGGFMLFNRPVGQTDEMMVEPTVSTDTVPPVATEETEAMMGDVVTVDMEAGAFFYTPKEIRVKKGQTVRINFKAVDMMHDFNIDELNVDGPVVQSGESTVVEFVASELGSFEYYCSVGQHRANGQVGTLIVEE